MSFDKANKTDAPMKRRVVRRRKKVCVFCGKENNQIDYKDVAKLKNHRKLCKTSKSSYSSN